MIFEGFLSALIGREIYIHGPDLEAVLMGFDSTWLFLQLEDGLLAWRIDEISGIGAESGEADEGPEVA